MPVILVVEDDDALAQPLASTLRAAGHEVTCAGTVASTTKLITNGLQPDLVLLDLGLPDGDGVQLCRWLRRQPIDPVIVVLTARDSEADVVVALDAGADDYLIKPYRLAELQARVRAHLRRVPSVENTLLSASGVVIDPGARRATAAGRELPLRPREFDLLAELVANAGRAVRREELMERVWDEYWDGSTKTLDMHVSTLRAKLAQAGITSVLTTLRGVGYRFENNP